MRRFLHRHPHAVSYSILFLVVGVLYVDDRGDDDREAKATRERKEQICYAIIEDRVTLSDIISFTGRTQPAIPEGVDTATRELVEASRAQSKKFRDDALARLSIPPQICKGTDITAHEVRADQEASLNEKGQ